MKDRILKIRKDAKLTQPEFGALIGATRPMIASYEGGKVVPDKSIQMLICSEFNVNPVWLETGEGNPYREGLIPKLVRVLRKYPALQSALEEMLDSMGPAEWEALNMVMEKAIERKNAK